MTTTNTDEINISKISTQLWYLLNSSFLHLHFEITGKAFTYTRLKASSQLLLFCHGHWTAPAFFKHVWNSLQIMYLLLRKPTFFWKVFLVKLTLCCAKNTLWAQLKVDCSISILTKEAPLFSWMKQSLEFELIMEVKVM